MLRIALRVLAVPFILIGELSFVIVALILGDDQWPE